MSNEDTKELRSKRLYAEEVKVQKQVKIAKANGLTNKDKPIKQPHRLAKHHAMDCGNPKCPLCGNPRHNGYTKDTLTIQEKSFLQDKLYDEEVIPRCTENS
jgi:hypothetical protein